MLVTRGLGGPNLVVAGYGGYGIEAVYFEDSWTHFVRRRSDGFTDFTDEHVLSRLARHQAASDKKRRQKSYGP